MKKKLIAIPIEIYKREFFYMLYLTLILIENDFQVVIGDQNEAIFRRLKKGIYFHKDHANWSRNLISKARKNLMKIAIFDVEGLIYISENDYVNTRISKEILEVSDFIFCWGEKQKKLLTKVVPNPKNIYVTGSPKIDISNLVLLKNSNKSIDKFSKNILINTRFAVNNGVTYEVELKNQKKLGIIKNNNDLKLFNDFYESDVQIYNEFLLLIEGLAMNHQLRITIRPHPREICETYMNLFSKFSNVIVDNKTQLSDQFELNDCVIHDGCTTAIEARASGLPVFGLRPRN